MTNAWKRLRQLPDSRDLSQSASERQQSWLLDCLRRNQETYYGRRFSFSSIRTPYDYQNHVPLVRYDELAPSIRSIQEGNKDILFKGTAHAFEMTGGSSGGKKLIPYSGASFRDFRTSILPWLTELIVHYNLNSGSAYFAISPACRKPLVLSSGIPVGLPDGAYLGNDILELFAEVSAVPAWVAKLESITSWQLATLYYLIQSNDLVMISVWSPTFFSMLLDAINTHAADLSELFLNGGQIANNRFYPDPDSHKRLHNYLENLNTATLWPHLKLVSCWADATSRPFFSALQQRLHHATFQGKGLLSTEGIVTVPNINCDCCLTVDSGFYEFIDDEGHVHLSDELDAGKQYEVVITTSGGLYRYRTGDRVLFRGLYNDLPILVFTGRLGLVTDMVGEKLTEEFVNHCLDDVPGFRMLVPVKIPEPRYILITDYAMEIDSKTTLTVVEKKLSDNPQYAYARRMGQLGKLDIMALTSPLEAYVKTLHTEGIRLGDIKAPALSSHQSWNSLVESMI